MLLTWKTVGRLMRNQDVWVSVLSDNDSTGDLPTIHRGWPLALKALLRLEVAAESCSLKCFSGPKGFTLWYFAPASWLGGGSHLPYFLKLFPYSGLIPLIRVKEPKGVLWGSDCIRYSFGRLKAYTYYLYSWWVLRKAYFLFLLFKKMGLWLFEHWKEGWHWLLVWHFCTLIWFKNIGKHIPPICQMRKMSAEVEFTFGSPASKWQTCPCWIHTGLQLCGFFQFVCFFAVIRGWN